MFADVFVPYPLDDAFTYAVPDGMAVAPGVRARVNFRGREVVAPVVGVHDRAPRDFAAKDILEIVDAQPVFDDRLVALARSVADDYLATMGETMAMALPSGTSPGARFRIVPGEGGAAVGLTPEQAAVRGEIEKGISAGNRMHLVFGVTGSGKTEVYMDLARRVIDSGRSVIYLVPEISLSSQIFSRLARVFGPELVLYHSQLTKNQRLHNWLRFYRGESRIAVGTRSAVFLQCPSLGLIVVDEEHDGSYKEHSTPRYNARRVAMQRGIAENAAVVLGSATPSLETLYACERGVISLHRIEGRYGGAGLPQVEVVRIDPRRPRDMLSTRLTLLTKRAIDAGEQTVLLLNRRGFSPIVQCGACGAPVECPHCSISMTFHAPSTMRCHYCGYECREPDRCGKCEEGAMVRLGSGTQRIEELVAKEFAGSRVFRLDQDSSRKKGTMEDLMARMGEGEVDILLGTQLVAKGLDFRRVTLVGVILADIGMNLPDFRATERIFALLVQAAGRSGRGDARGRVVVQTMNEEHPLFPFLVSHDYMGFCRQELPLRREMGYPPFRRLARLLVRGADERRVADAARALGVAARDAAASCGVTVLGPSTAPFQKIAGNYRHHIILKSPDAASLRKVASASRGAVSGPGLYLEIDIDPYDLL